MTNRMCAGCQVCCEIAPVVPLGKPARTVCKHQCAVGCAIYQDRPECCAAYQCSWLASELPEWAKPDVTGVFAETIIIPLELRNGNVEKVKLVIAVVFDAAKAAEYRQRLESASMVEACDVVVVVDEHQERSIVSRTQLGVLAVEHMARCYRSPEGVTFRYADGAEVVLKQETEGA